MGERGKYGTKNTFVCNDLAFGCNAKRNFGCNWTSLGDQNYA